MVRDSKCINIFKLIIFLIRKNTLCRALTIPSTGNSFAARIGFGQGFR